MSCSKLPLMRHAIKTLVSVHRKIQILEYNFFFSFKILSKMSTQIPTHHVKDSSNRKFYSIPEEYLSFQEEIPDVCQCESLLKEIYSNISSHNASFEGPFGRRQVLYCDYAASGQPLKFIEEFISEEVLPFYGNTHTTNTATSLQSTYFRHEAKDIIRKAVNASEHDAVIFTGNGCTSAVTKLISVLQFDVPTIVFVGPYEHHSNLLPWREISSKVVRIGVTDDGLVDLKCLEDELKTYDGKGYKLIGSFSAASNVTGIIADDKAISLLLHKYGALALWDYAAAGPYVEIDMNPVVLGKDEGLAYKDAIFLSTHKFIGGVDSPGILIAKKKLFENKVPSEPGGGTIFFVSRERHRYLKNIEMREEGGTPSIIGAIRAGMAFQLKAAVGHSLISKRENEICRKVLDKWSENENLLVLGSTVVPRLPIFSFVIFNKISGMYLHHNFICTLLNDLFGIQSRSGCACAGPYALDVLGINEALAQDFDTLLAEDSSLDRVHLRRQGEFSEREILRPGFIRLCLPYFMPDEDIDFIIEAVMMVAENGWKLLPQYLFNPETGEWKHKNKLIFTDRKWLGSISYKKGYFSFNNRTHSSKISPQVGLDLLNSAELIFGMSIQAATRKFVPDQELIFDDESSVFRWFLLPSEAKQYLLGERSGAIKEKLFTINGSVKSGIEGKNSELLDDKECNIDSNITCYNDRLASETELSCHHNKVNSRLNICNLKNSTAEILKCSVYKPSLSPKYEISQDIIPKCKWHSPPTSIFRPFVKAVSQFNMIKDGDRVLTCVSGGKDSLSLLHTLRQYRFYAKKKGIHFQLGAMTVDPKSPLYDPSPLKNYLAALGVPYFYEEQDILPQAMEMEKCTSICSFCSRLKRGRIYACARREDYNVIALGQHLDDLAESFVMSVFHNGRLRTMKASYTEKSSSLRIIRPFVLVRENDLRKFAEQKKLPVIPENCPACFEAPKERHRVKQLLAAQEVQFPTLYHSLKRAMYPLMAINATGVEDKLLGKKSCINTDCSSTDSEDE